MEIYVHLSASASSEKLIRELQAMIIQDIPHLSKRMGIITPTKKNHLNDTWYGMKGYAENLNPPEGYCYMDTGPKTVDWENIMKKYAKFLNGKGCVYLEFSNSVSSDYNIDLSTTPDGSVFVFDPDKDSERKKLINAFSANPDAYHATFCDFRYGLF